MRSIDENGGDNSRGSSGAGDVVHASRLGTHALTMTAAVNRITILFILFFSLLFVLL